MLRRGRVVQALGESPVTDQWRTFYGWDVSPIDVTLTRQRVRRCVEQDWGVKPVIAEDVELLVSELTSNVVRHAAGTRHSMFRVHIYLTSTHVRVECVDGSHRLPQTSDVSHDDEAGRGLVLVKAVASRYGVQLRLSGKCVWAEKDLA